MPSHLASTATVSTPLSRTALLMPALLLFISGATAQIYQVLWIKQLSLVIGVEVHAITTGISAFFAGLALGGLLFGRFADRLGKPLLLYAGLEIGVAVLGIGATLGLSLAAAPFAWLEQQVGLLAGLLPLLLVGLPALLMGGTLPVLVRALANAAHDPGIQVRLRDGRQELLRSEQRYDLITLEPPPPSAAGVVNLYSRDFYQLAAQRLQANGLVAQWLPLPTQNIDDSRSLVRSFLDVFPYATLWTSEFHEMLLVGSMQPIELDAARISARFEQPGVRNALQDVGVASGAALLATYVTDRAGLERFAGDAPAVTDDQPRIEYAPWVRAKEISRVLPALLDLHTAPVLLNAEPAFINRMNVHRQRLMQFYRSSLHAYDGDREAWARDIREVINGDGSNPYYRWFVGQ